MMSTTVRAPEFTTSGLTWFNTPAPLRLAGLRGRLVVLDFWTYCCINCQHVLPTLRLLEEAFPDHVTIIGVHSPKFPAERDPATVAAAIARHDIRHPVVHDPFLTVWEAYAIRAWPTLVVIGPDGAILGQLSGEPDPTALLDGMGGLIAQYQQTGRLQPSPESWLKPSPRTGHFSFPSKIRPLPGASPQWVVADSGHHQIVVLDDAGQTLKRYGQGGPGLRDGTADHAQFRAPQGVAADEHAIWVADTENHALRRIDRRTGTVTTVAGHGRRGGPIRRPVPARDAVLASPWDVTLWHGLVWFANAGTHQLGVYDPACEDIRLAAGTSGEDRVDGPALHAALAQPSGLAVLDDRLCFVDSETSSVRWLDPHTGKVGTWAGQGLFDFGHVDGPTAEALFQHPLGLCVDGVTLLIADSYNNALRRLRPADHRVETLDLGVCQDALCRPLAQPAGIWAEPDRLLLVDSNNHRIIAVDRAAGTYRTWAE